MHAALQRAQRMPRRVMPLTQMYKRACAACCIFFLITRGKQKQGDQAPPHRAPSHGHRPDHQQNQPPEAAKQQSRQHRDTETQPHSEQNGSANKQTKDSTGSKDCAGSVRLGAARNSTSSNQHLHIATAERSRATRQTDRKAKPNSPAATQLQG